MDNVDQTIQMLIILLVGAFVILFILVMIYIFLKVRENRTNEDGRESEKGAKDSSLKSEKSKEGFDNGKRSVMDFMEFDKIEDNMIIQENGKRCIMVIECQGVNYDLMSGVEKTGVEEGFVQFLNTLRHPIQIYIQTRTINLENSINTYKKRLNDIESNLFKMRQRYEALLESETASKDEINKAFFELSKQTNLYEYSRDIIYNTEKMSLNKNILNKQYYIVIALHTSELGSTEYDKEELMSMAFSELYNRAQSVIRSISACSVNAKIMNSMELAELLYVAYNRDESETFDLKKAMRAEYDSLYSTAPDVLDKKMKELDKEIERKAIDIVTEKVEKFRSEKREKVEQKEASIDELADEMAMIILEENRRYLGDEIVDCIKEEEVKKNENEKAKKATRNSRTK